MAFRQLRGNGGGTYVKWDTPKTVKGRLVGFIKGSYKNQPTTTILLKQDDGTEIKVNGTTNIENSGLYNEEPGVLVEFVYKGKGKGKTGNTYNDIEVFVDSPEPEPGKTPAPAPSASAPSAEPETFEALKGRLILANPKGAEAVLAALEGMGLAPDAKAAKLREFLKVQG